MNTPIIKKADGTEEPFDNTKLISSLKRAGTGDELIQTVVREVEKELTDGMTTGEIYRKAFRLLKQHEKTSAGRYSLRRAILNLGPTGFPFEDFLAELFRSKGYNTGVRNIIEGACATHEVDLVVTREDHCTAIEAKFHNKAGAKTDLKVALYVHSRFIDKKA